MTQTWIELTRIGRDAALSAYYFRKACQETPEEANTHSGELVELFESLEPSAAEALLDRIAPGGEKVLPVLQRVLKAEERPQVKARLIYHLSCLERDPQFGTVLSQHLAGSRHPRVKAACLTGLARMKASMAFRDLKPYLVDPDSRVRANAVESLLAHDIRSFKEVLNILLNDECGRVKAQAALGLWRLGSSVLLDLARDAEIPSHRVSLLHALGQTGRDPRARDILHSSLGARDDAERHAAARSLAKMADHKDIPGLLESAVKVAGQKARQALLVSAEEVDPFYTQSVLGMLLERADRNRESKELATVLAMAGTLRRPYDPGQIHLFLDADDGRVRANALEALGPRLAKFDGCKTLLKTLRSDIPRVKANSAVLLWKEGFHGAVTELREMLGNASARFRASAVHALGRIGGLVAEGLLERALQDTEAGVRTLAFQGLSGEFSGASMSS